jgi:HTH-type transcriptional regulator/antitoxin HigA
MIRTSIINEEDYKKSVIRMMEIFDAELDSPEQKELESLIRQIEDYDNKHFNLPELNH